MERVAKIALQGLRKSSTYAHGSRDISLEKMDVIKLTGLMFHGHHGVLPEVCVATLQL
jgi:hypothetical protein